MKTSRCAAIIAVLICFLSFAGCRSNQGGNLPTVKVAINTWPGLGPYYVAKAKGFDKEEGINSMSS